MKVLTADDHWVARAGVRYSLKRLGRQVEVLEAESIDEALNLVDANPDLDLILLDLLIPGMRRFEGIQALRERAPQVPIVIFTVSEDRHDIVRAIDLGAMGYIPKASLPDEFVKAVRLVLSGEFAIPRRLMEQSGPSMTVDGDSGSKPPAAATPDASLTKRQSEIFELLGGGMSNAQIARELGLSENTVRVHISAIFKRLGLNNRTQLALLAASRDRTN